MPVTPPARTAPAWPRLGRQLLSAQVVPIAPAPVEIPLHWLTTPVRLRLEQPVTTSAVDNAGFGTAYDSDSTALATYGDFPFAASLQSATSQDGPNLASWSVTYRSTPLTRAPELTIDLMHRTDPERATLLQLQRHQRIRLIQTPPEFPQGATELIISGITHEIGVTQRRIRFTTRPVIGTSVGVSGPWFRLGVSALDGTDHLLF